jgi:polysaccharide pyruvyl transferase WcaK-like protein
MSESGAAQVRQFPRILIYSGWNTKNIGDQGHTPGTLRFLTQYFPEAALTIWLRSTNEETKTLLKTRFPRIEIVQGRLDESGSSENPALQKAFSEADLLLHNSGMIYNSFWKSPTILKTCHLVRKPICLYGQSFDGFEEEVKAEMVGLLSKTMAIYCRDNESLYYLRRIGVKPPILEFGPDGCFGIDLLNEEKSASYLNRHGLASKKFLVVILRTNTPGGKRPEILPEWDFGDTTQNPWNPTEKDEIQVKLWTEKLREVIMRWVTETGLKVLLAPEVEEEIVYAKRLLYDALPKKIQQNVVHKAEWWNMDEACSVYKQAHSLVAMEPHSCIMALANRVPMIHFFSRRHGLKAWMFRDIGLPEWLHDIDEEPVDGVIDTLMAIHGNYPRALDKVDRAMNFVEQRSKEMVNDIKSLVT